MIYLDQNALPENEIRAVMISRLLNPEQKSRLLAWAHLAYAAESSVRKLYAAETAGDGICTRRTQEYSCENNLLRREER